MIIKKRIEIYVLKDVFMNYNNQYIYMHILITLTLTIEKYNRQGVFFIGAVPSQVEGI